MFDREWLDEVNHLEYPFDLCGALTYKFGFGSDQEAFKKEAPKFSLLTDGTLAKPCTKLFLVNVSSKSPDTVPPSKFRASLSRGTGYGR